MITTARIVGIGAGGHAKVVIDALRVGGCSVAALVEQNPVLWGAMLLGVPIVGGDDRLVQLRRDGVDAFFVGVGMIRNYAARARLFELGVGCGLAPFTVVHPAAVVSSDAQLAEGVTILAGAVVNAGARIGSNAIVNTRAVVEHDCTIGEHAHVSTGACLAGGVTVCRGAHVGIGASVREGIRIGEGAVVGAGAAVVSDVADGVVVAGVPAIVLEQRVRG